MNLQAFHLKDFENSNKASRVATKSLFYRQVDYSYLSDSSQIIDSSPCNFNSGKFPKFFKSGSVGRFWLVSRLDNKSECKLVAGGSSVTSSSAQFLDARVVYSFMHLHVSQVRGFESCSRFMDFSMGTPALLPLGTAYHQNWLFSWRRQLCAGLSALGRTN